MNRLQSFVSLAIWPITRAAFVAAVLWLLNNELYAQPGTASIEIAGTSEAIIAPTRFAWCCELSPDETWLVACYGFFQGEAGRIRVWDLKTGKVRWEANESRGVRRVAISPDGSIVASGNYGGEIRLRDAATGEVRRTFDNDGGSVECVAFSTDGRRIVSCGNRRVLRLWDVATGRMLQAIDGRNNFEGHSDTVYGVHFSEDDKFLLSHGRDRSVRRWNVDDGRELRMFAHAGPVYDAIFLPGGKQVATACEDGEVRIFGIDSDVAVTTLPPFMPQHRFASALAVSRDGKQLAVGNATRIHVWNASDWKSVTTLEEPRSYTWGLNFSHDGKTLFSAGTDSSVRVWDLATKAEKQRFSAPPSEPTGAGQIRALAVSPDDKMLATAARGRGVELRDRTTGEMLKWLPTRHAEQIAFSRDGKTLAVAGGGLSFWDIKSGELRQDLLGKAAAIAFSPDGKQYATGGSDGAVRLCEQASGKEVAALTGHTDQVVAVAFSPDGKRLVSASNDSTACVWDLEKHAQVATLKGHAAAINAVGYSTDGKTIATASNDGTARVWSVTGYQSRAALAHQQPVVSLAFAADGQTLATGGEEGGIWLSNTARGTQRKLIAGHFGAVRGLAFLADESGLVSASEDASIRFWKATDSAISPLVFYSAHSPEALCVTYSPDGKWLITGGADKSIAVRDSVSGVARRTLRGHTNRVNRLTVSPDSTQVASSSGDGTVRIWSVQRGEMITSFNAWNEKFAAARSVVFAPDGRTLASGADDGTIKLWDTQDQKELRVLTRQTLPITSLVFTNDSSLLVSATGDWRNNRVAGELRLWEVTSGKELGQLKGCASEIKCIAIDKGGGLLASTEANSDLRLWDLANRSLVRTIRLETLSASLAFSPDGQRLATGHYNGGITLWDVPALTPIQRYAGHTKGIPGVAFSADGKFLATTGTDGKLAIWPVE